jgi:hypothetical protein
MDILAPWLLQMIAWKLQNVHMTMVANGALNGRDVQYGHVEVLKYLHVHGCPWDKHTCSWAIEKGHLEVPKYAHTNGCPWDSKTSAKAEDNGHIDVLESERRQQGYHEDNAEENEDCSGIAEIS